MNIGIFGGTFNPVHLGHRNCLISVIDQIKLARVIVMPDRIPPHKAAQELASPEDRLNMCRLAFGDIAGVEFSDWELRQAGKSYSVLTLRHLKKLYPDDKLFFIMGSDMLLSFEQWYRYEEILSLASLACVARLDEDIDKLEPFAEILRAKNGEVFIIRTEPFDISSSEIRDMLKKNLDCSCYLDKNVVQYIVDKNLYDRGFTIGGQKSYRSL